MAYVVILMSRIFQPDASKRLLRARLNLGNNLVWHHSNVAQVIKLKC